MIMHEQVVEKIYTLQAPLVREVDNFIDFLMMRYLKINGAQNDLSPETMTQFAIAGGAFDWLLDPAEKDIYSEEDGEPI